MDQDDGRRERTEDLMCTSEELGELTRQSRIRLAAADDTRAEHRIISEQSRRRLVESRDLLDRAAARWERPAPALEGDTV